MLNVSNLAAKLLFFLQMSKYFCNFAVFFIKKV